MDNVSVELELKLNAARALDLLERQALATGNKIERQLQNSLRNAIKLARNSIKLDVDSTGVKRATADVKLLNAELRQTSNLVKSLKAVNIGVSSRSGSRGGNPGSNAANQQEKERERMLRMNAALTRQMQQEELKGLQQIASLERQIASANTRAAGGATGRRAAQLHHEARLYQENVRHAQLLAKIKASPISPSAAKEAERLAHALNSINIMSLNQQFNQLNTSANRGTRGASSLVSNIAGGVAGAATGAALNLAGNALGGAARMVGGGLAESTQLALAYGNALNTLQVNTSATTAEMTKINAAVLDSSGYFGVMPDILAANALELGRMGVSAEAMPEHLRAIGNTSRATGQSIDIATSAVEQLKTIFSEMSVDDISDVLTVAANVSPTGLQGIAQAYAFIGTSAEQAGVSMETVGEQIVLLQKAGLEATIAGTSLNRLYTDIRENADVFEEVGVSVFDASGKIRDMGTIIQETGKAMEGFTDEQRAAFLEPLDTNSVRALEILSSKYKESAADVAEMRKQLQAATKDNVAMTQAAKALNDPLVKLEQFQAKLAQLGLKLAQSFIPGIEGATEFGTAVIDSLLTADNIFADLKKSADEFKQYLEENPQLVGMLADALGEVARQLSGAILDQTRELLDHLEKNPHAINDAINGIKEFGSNLANVVKSANDLVGFLTQAYTKMKEIKLIQEMPDTSSVSSFLWGDLAPNIPTWLGGTQGQPQRSPGGTTGGEMGGISVDRLRSAIMGQESGGNPQAVNPHSGALGLYQVMPENVASWSEQVLGRSVGTDEFLANAELQTQIVNGVMSDMLNRAIETSGGNAEEAIRKVAAEWYSGQQSLFDDPTPQTYGAGSYPSIQEYTRSIAERYGMAATMGGSSGAAAVMPQETEAERIARMGGGDAIISPGARSTGGRAAARTIAPVGIRTMGGQEYGASRDGGSRAHAGEDFDLAAGQASSTYIGGVVQEIQDWGEYGLAALIYNAKLGVTEIVAEFSQAMVKVGDTVSPGAAIGMGGDDVAGVQHTEIHRGQGRTGNTTNPLEFYRSIGVDPATGKVYADGSQSGSTGGAPTTAREEAAEKKRLELLKQARQQQEEITKLTRQQRDNTLRAAREQARIANENTLAQVQGTPFEGVAQRTIDSAAAMAKYEDAINSATDDLEDLQTALAKLDERKNEPGIAAVKSQYEQAIAAQREYIKGLETQSFMEQASLRATSTAAAEREREAKRQEMAQRSAEASLQNLTLEVQRYLGTIKDADIQGIVQQSFTIDDNQNGYVRQIEAVNQEIDNLEEQLTRASDAGLDFDNPEIQMVIEQLATLKDIVNTLQANSKIQLEIDTRVQGESIDAYTRNLRQQLGNAKADQLEARGDTFGANEIRRNMAQSEQGRNSDDRYAAIMALSGSVSPERMMEMVDIANELDAVELDNITQQFKDFSAAAEEAGKQILSTFAKSILSGEDFGDAMMSLFQSITSALADMLIQMAMAELFGSIGGGSSGGVSDALSGIGAAFGVFSQGNLDTIPNFANGNIDTVLNFAKGLDAAFSRERAALGGKPYVAVVNTDEAILSAPQTKRFMQLGLDKVVSHASGTMPKGASILGGNTTINVPVNVQTGGGRINEKALEFAIKSTVKDTIRREQRPGNSLNP